MADFSIGGSAGTTGLSHLTDPLAPGDKIPVVNVSDTSTSPAGTAGSDQYMTVADLAGAVSAVIYPPADTTGAAGAALIEAARLALGGAPGLIRLAPGTWYVSCGVIGAFVTGQWIDATGCVINAKASGDLFNFTDSSTYATRTVSGAGILGYPVIGGTATTGTSNGIHAGDIFRLVFDVTVHDFAFNAASCNILFDNRHALAEEIRADIYSLASPNLVKFTQTPGPGTPFGSFERSRITFQLDQGGNNQNNGITCANGTYFGNSNWTVGGNFSGGASPTTAAVFTLTGTTPSGSADGPAGTTPTNLLFMFCDVGVECTAGTHTPTTFSIDAVSGDIVGLLFGNMNFGLAGANFTPTSGVVGFFGLTDGGDPAIVAQTVQTFLFQGQLGIGTYAAAASLSNGSTVSASASWALLTSAAAVTGLILAAGSWDGQVLLAVNTGPFSMTFAAPGTSRVADGANDVIPAGQAAFYAWSVNAGTWYRVQQGQFTAYLSGSFTSGTGTAQQNVTGLSAYLGVGTWKVRGWFPYVGAGTVGSTQKFAFTFSGTASGSAGYAAWTNKAAAYAPPAVGAAVTTAVTTATITSTVYVMEVEATVVVTAAGTLQLTVQSTTSGDEILIEAGARLEVAQVG